MLTDRLPTGEWEMTRVSTQREGGTLHLLVVGEWLSPYVDLLGSLIDVPVDIEFVPTENLAAIAEADVVVASSFSASAAKAAGRLRLLQLAGSGFDGICLEGLDPRVVVANCYEHECGIAEYVLMQCLALSSGLLRMDRDLRRGDWGLAASGGGAPRRELGERTLGIIGLGHIGCEVARLAAAFKMHVIAATRHVPPPSEWSALRVNSVVGLEHVQQILRASDFVVIAVPLNEQTRSLIGREELACMKPDAYLINPSRGAIVDEKALFDALRSDAIAGAAIDTWYRYPDVAGGRLTPSMLPFETLGNVIMTPHIAGYTANTMNRRMRVIARNISSFVANGFVANRVLTSGFNGDGTDFKE